MSDFRTTQSRESLPTVSLVGGLAAAVGFIWLLAIGMPGFNPPEWSRIVGTMLIPLGILTSVMAGLLSRSQSGFRKALVGMLLSALVIVGFVIVMFSYDY